MFRVGRSNCGAPLTEELFRSYREGGIRFMELSMRIEGYDALDYAWVRELSQAHGVTLWSLHLPFAPFRILDPSRPDLAKDTVAYFRELIQKGVAIGIDKFVVHASGEPIPTEERSLRMACAKESLRALAEFAGERGAVIAVEDLPRTCLGRDAEEMLELLDAHDALRVCFDTNHLLTQSPVEFIEQVGEKIITTHVSDYDFVDERHWLPGEGLVDWTALVQALQNVKYQGVWMYELGLRCPKTLVRERDLEHADFLRNATEIFENRPLTRLGSPLPKE